MPNLFDGLTLRSLNLRNRIGVSPMCQYSSLNGFANEWHLVHLGSFSSGGPAVVTMEATAVEPIGRISAYDHGLWKDEHISYLKTITGFIIGQGAIPAIQIAHAGRKASRTRPWEGDGDLTNEKGGWEVVGPSPIAFAEGYRTPRELSVTEIQNLVESFVNCAKRSLQAGFQILEIHGAHGYLIHSFLSPLSNHRKDNYGGSLANRSRILIEIAEAVRNVWPAELPLFTRLSCSDWVEGGWTIEDSIAVAKELRSIGVDLIDCSSGGNVKTKIPIKPGYQVAFAEAIRREAGIPTAAVGLITEAKQADEIIRDGKADLVLLAREMLRDPHWTFRAAKALHLEDRLHVPSQYLRSF